MSPNPRTLTRVHPDLMLGRGTSWTWMTSGGPGRSTTAARMMATREVYPSTS